MNTNARFCNNLNLEMWKKITIIFQWETYYRCFGDTILYRLRIELQLGGGHCLSSSLRLDVWKSADFQKLP
jgi:hypothetical protein